MTLLQGAGELVLWCMAGVIGFAIAVVVALWAWDKWSWSRLEQQLKRRKG